MISEAKDFANTSKGWQDRWEAELLASRKMLRKWHKRGNKTIEVFLDSRGAGESDAFKLNLFNSTVSVMRSLLFGSTPKVDVSRRYADQDDDVARVAGEILYRMLNNDTEESGEDFATALRCALDDRLLPGFGLARVRYELQTDKREIDATYDETGEEVTAAYVDEVLLSEEAEVDYVHWRDVLWSYSRNWKELRWLAFRSYLNKDEAAKRFGEKTAALLDYKIQNAAGTRDSQLSNVVDTWQKAEIWEIWHKDDRKVYWFSQGTGRILDIKDDPLQLQGFWPAPKAMIANLTTTTMLPVPDYYIAQDLYQEIDRLETRISILTDAVKAVGVYDSAAEGVQRMFKEGVENDLIPVENWSQFAEKGGIRGCVDWMPIADIVSALDKLVQRRDDAIKLLYQVTGLSDMMRGGSTQGNARVSATEQGLKARFGSIRIQALQDEFARFASDLAALKAEIICKHFSPETIVRQSNMEYSPDREYLPAALQLLKDSYAASWRIEIKSENVAMTDYAQLQSERTQYINALAVFLQSSAPLVQFEPKSAPILMELLKWGLAGFKGSNQIEGIIDKAIEQMQTAAKQPQQSRPSPEEAKAQAKLDEIQAKHKAKLDEIQVDSEADLKLIKAKTQGAIREEQAETLFNIEEEKARGTSGVIQSYAKSLSAGSGGNG